MPWSGTGISDTALSEAGYVIVPDSAYQAACVTPVMIKASEGGGGNGIRKAEHSEAFKNLAEAARHPEVQLLADQYGNAISLFGRDCFVQRRYQKSIEEAPVTIAKPDKKRERAAVRLAKLVGYVSAGIVEYLYSHADDSFHFLEVEPRLQVENPTIETVSGAKFLAAQLQVAMGLTLYRIRHIRAPVFWSLRQGQHKNEKAAATAALERREAILQPTYKQIARLYVDLHDRTGRMEAKGFANLLFGRMLEGSSTGLFVLVSHVLRLRLDNWPRQALVPNPTPEGLEKLDLSQTVTQFQVELNTMSDTFFHILIWHGEVVAQSQWRKQGYQDEEYENFQEFLEARVHNAQVIIIHLISLTCVNKITTFFSGSQSMVSKIV
ncbi:hypothetical protein FB446DRAFT_820403 [Lentinula raphanica]|nr:hypothetical protein C8R42DRAFT_649322 [Lentinula raphanica]KAJ3767398.1 hypothetical protein FB446DRAFT_820403 [Lentinula raphanica]